MKRHCFFALALALTLCASAALAIFPGQQYGLVNPGAVGDGYLTFTMQQGWLGGVEAWYICTDTNDIRWAQWYNLTLAPKLSAATAPAGGAQIVYWVLNPPASQGPIFTAAPGQAGYSPIGQIHYITWNPGASKAPITSASQLSGLNGQITITRTDIRVNCPILALYRLGGPFLPKPPPFYRIPQGRILSGIGTTRQIQLPYWNVYCQDPITRAITVKRVIIPDAWPANLAQLIGANVAPNLLPVFNSQRNLMYVINWAQDFDPTLPGIQPLKVRIDQYPVLCACPNFCSWRNTNFDYSPVSTFQLLDRLYPTPPGYPVPAETLYKTCDFIEQQIQQGNLIPVTYPTPPLPPPPGVVGYQVRTPIPFVLNAPVICNGNGSVCP